jgi:hypothetical protein
MKEHRPRRVSADLGPRRSQRARPDFCHGLLVVARADAVVRKYKIRDLLCKDLLQFVFMVKTAEYGNCRHTISGCAECV